MKGVPDQKKTNKWYDPLVNAVRAGLFVLGHALVACILIATLAAVDALLKFFGEPKLFGRVPLAYVFDVMDCVILILFVSFGSIEAVKAFKGTDRDSGQGAAAQGDSNDQDSGLGDGVAGAQRVPPAASVADHRVSN